MLGKDPEKKMSRFQFLHPKGFFGLKHKEGSTPRELGKLVEVHPGPVTAAAAVASDSGSDSCLVDRLKLTARGCTQL